MCESASSSSDIGHVILEEFAQRGKEFSPELILGFVRLWQDKLKYLRSRLRLLVRQVVLETDSELLRLIFVLIIADARTAQPESEQVLLVLVVERLVDLPEHFYVVLVLTSFLTIYVLDLFFDEIYFFILFECGALGEYHHVVPVEELCQVADITQSILHSFLDKLHLSLSLLD